MFRKLFGFGKKKNVDEIDVNEKYQEESVQPTDEGPFEKEEPDTAVPASENESDRQVLDTSSATDLSGSIDKIEEDDHHASSPQQDHEAEHVIGSRQAPHIDGISSPVSGSDLLDISSDEDLALEVNSISQEEEILDSAKEDTDLSEEALGETTLSEQNENIESDSFEDVQDTQEEIGFFAKIKQGLFKTKQNFSKKLDELFSGYAKIDDEIFEELEELLILGDLGFETATSISEELRKRSHEKKIEELPELEKELESIIEEILLSSVKQEEEKYPQIMVIVGVNGVGKTTSIGKISSQLKREGKSVMLAAGDTFRAAAADQLSIWAERADVPIVRSNEGADPSSVIFDAIRSAQAKNIDVLICDTAGRLHNKKNLMQELDKIFRIIDREYPEAHKEVLLVIDATTGQNAVNQAKTFLEVAPLTGMILTKLDGTAKGGVVIGLSKELQIPIKYVGVGEKINDLQKFNARDFARALFSKN